MKLQQKGIRTKKELEHTVLESEAYYDNYHWPYRMETTETKQTSTHILRSTQVFCLCSLHFLYPSGSTSSMLCHSFVCYIQSGTASLQLACKELVALEFLLLRQLLHDVQFGRLRTERYANQRPRYKVQRLVWGQEEPDIRAVVVAVTEKVSSHQRHQSSFEEPNGSCLEHPTIYLVLSFLGQANRHGWMMCESESAGCTVNGGEIRKKKGRKAM